MPKSLREQLEESFDDSEEEQEAGGSEQDPEESLGDTEEEVHEDRSEGEPADELDDPPADEPDSEDETDESVSDEAADDGDDEPPEEPEEVVEKIKAPASWKPAAREHWKALPLDVQREVARREDEISKGMYQASQHRKVAEEYVNVIKPFQHLIQAQNSTPSQAIHNMMSTAAQLTMGSKAQKAQVVSEIIQNYDVDIETLDTVLAGLDLPDNVDDDPLFQKLDERLKPVTEFMGQFQTVQQTQTTQIQEQANKDLEEFAEKNDFYEDVRDDMADMMELAAKRGRAMTLQQAYDIACQQDPEIKKVIDQRKAAKRMARPSGDELEKKKRASASIPGGAPTGASAGKGEGTLRDTIGAAFEEAEQR